MHNEATLPFRLRWKPPISEKSNCYFTYCWLISMQYPKAAWIEFPRNYFSIMSQCLKATVSKVWKRVFHQKLYSNIGRWNICWIRSLVDFLSITRSDSWWIAMQRARIRWRIVESERFLLSSALLRRLIVNKSAQDWFWFDWSPIDAGRDG